MFLVFSFILPFLSFMWDYKSPRSLAMGGISASLQDTQTSFFFNPAGMFGTKSLDIIAREIYESYNLISDAGKFAKLSGNLSQKPEEALKSVRDSYGKNYVREFFYFPHFALSVGNVSFGLGALLGAGLGTSISLPSNTILKDTFAFTRGEVVLGGAVSFLDRSVIAGLSISAFKIAYEGDIVVRENEIGQGITSVFPVFGEDMGTVLNDAVSGKCEYPFRCAIGFGGFNVGVIWEPMKKGVRLGFDLRDILDPMRSTTGDLGVSYYDELKIFSYVLGVDFQDILFVSGDSSLLKRFHVGAEVSLDKPFKRFLSFMFGVGQLYPSFGLELNLKALSFTLGTYAREFGKEVGGQPIRFYFFKLAI
ncbi:MAG: hypothetical protein ACO2PO_01550, partial [Candidatus Calescibacterium sp.]